jgi:hypothetical protein
MPGTIYWLFACFMSMMVAIRIEAGEWEWVPVLWGIFAFIWFMLLSFFVINPLIRYGIYFGWTDADSWENLLLETEEDDDDPDDSDDS